MMSNRIYFMSIIFILTFLCSSYLHAQSVTVFIPKDLTAAPSESGVKVPVNVTNLTAFNVSSAELTVSYDTKILTATGVTVTDTIAEGSIAYRQIDDTSGTIKISMARGIPFNGSGTLIFIIFDVDSDNPGDSSFLDLVKVKLYPGVSVATDNGTITIELPADAVIVSIPKNLRIPPEVTEIKAPVNVSEVTGLGIISAHLLVSYNPSVIAATSATLSGTIAEGGSVIANPDNVNGTIEIALIFSTPQLHALSGSGTLVYINFDVTSNSSNHSSLISLTQVNLNWNTIVKKNGCIIVNFIRGDVSRDWEITAHDAELIFRHLVGLETLNIDQIEVGDVSKNGRLTSLDAALIMQYSTGLIPKF